MEWKSRYTETNNTRSSVLTSETLACDVNMHSATVNSNETGISANFCFFRTKITPVLDRTGFFSSNSVLIGSNLSCFQTSSCFHIPVSDPVHSLQVLMFSKPSSRGEKPGTFPFAESHFSIPVEPMKSLHSPLLHSTVVEPQILTQLKWRQKMA